MARRQFVVSIPEDNEAGLDTPADIARGLIYANGLYGGQIRVRPADDDSDGAWVAPDSWERS
jgi:hypothetical protein